MTETQETLAPGISGIQIKVVQVLFSNNMMTHDNLDRAEGKEFHKAMKLTTYIPVMSFSDIRLEECQPLQEMRILPKQCVCLPTTL